MRGNRMGMAVLCTALGMVTSLYAGRDERKTLPETPGDPDAGLPFEYSADEESFPALAATGCEVIGGSTIIPTNTFVLRGNAFRISRPSDLTEIQIELGFGAMGAPVPANVSFSIHKNVGTSANPIWEHFWSQDPPIVLSGTGRKFYSSGPISPPQLAVDTEYAIAATWGGVSIQYFRDNQTYPRNYSDGLVLGAIGTNIPTGPPLDPETDFFFLPFGGGAYSMQLCIQPKPGACCTGTSCQDTLTQTQCLAQGGNFSEELLTCAQLNLLGGCPLPTGICCQGIACSIRDPYECDRQGGAWQPGTSCASGGDNPCLSTGACCRPDGTCAVLSELNCQAANGVYQGDASTCAGVGSACLLGACCKNGFCNYVSRSSCTALGGLWRGAGSNCGGDLCDPTGACCAGENCAGGADAVTAVDCQAVGGAYQGNWTSCSSLPADCGKGACCTSAFGCVGNVDLSVCGILGGTFRGTGTSCDTINPPCAGTCCFQGSCLANPATPVQCAALSGGVFVGYGSNAACNQNPCVVASGRCCMPSTGACFVTSSEGCMELGGNFSAGGTCSPNSCPQPGAAGACCLPGGFCALLTQAKCAAEGGAFNGAGSACSLELCAVGACCPADGSACLNNATVSGCNAVSGTYFSGETCATVTCPPTGACCLPDGSCQRTTASNCSLLNGIYAGDGVNCATGTFQCTRRSCCLSDGSCLTTIFSRCGPMGGSFDPTSGPCSSQNACGACCTAGQCQALTEFRCTGYHHGEGTACTSNPPLCQLGTCCTRDGACSEVIEAECAAIQGLFGRGLSCATDPCPPTGACCQTDSTCDVILEFACTAEGGTYRGDGATCTAGACDRGACCLPDGSCTDTIAALCAGQGGAFSVGDTCANFTCPATGACCVQGACQTLTDFGCSAAGGAYEGDDTPCTPGLCDPGACCGRNGGCVNGTVTPCHASGGSFLSGADCGAAPCPAVGACCADDETCEVVSAATCVAEGGTYAGDSTVCSADLCTPSACCPPVGQACSVETRLVCEQNGGTYVPGEVCPPSLPHPSNPCNTGGCCRLDGTCEGGVIAVECAAPDEFHVNMACLIDFTCEARGACCSMMNVCSIELEADCAFQGGDYLGHGVSCSPDPCNPVQIVGSDPPSGVIDARRPHATDSAVPAEGIHEIDVTFDNDVSMLTVSDFAITETGGDGAAPMLIAVTPQSTTVLRMTFDRPIDPGAWTRIAHISSGTRTCIGFLPGDVNGSGMVEVVADVTALRNDLTTAALALYAADTNRSGAATAEDLTELVNLLNGAGAQTAWDNAALPGSPCP